MKKFIRYLRLKRQSPADQSEHLKRKQRYEADFTLEPFAGLTPEYMEMSERGLRGGRPGRPSTQGPGRPHWPAGRQGPEDARAARSPRAERGQMGEARCGHRQPPGASLPVSPPHLLPPLWPHRPPLCHLDTGGRSH